MGSLGLVTPVGFEPTNVRVKAASVSTSPRGSMTRDIDNHASCQRSAGCINYSANYSQ